MRSHTVTAVLGSTPEMAFEYLADIERLPEWANEFARELRKDGAEYKVINGLGEFFFEVKADASTGVIDMYAGPSRTQLAMFPTRVVGLPDGRCAYSFTMFQVAGMPDELFQSQYESLQREFVNLERILR